MVTFILLLSASGPYLVYQIVSVNTSFGQVADVDAARHITFFGTFVSLS
jgi:hypothetical protein